MSALTIQGQKAQKLHTPSQIVSDIKQYFTKAPKQARQIYLDETPDLDYQSKSFQPDSIVARDISLKLISSYEPQKWKSYPFKIMYLVASFLYKAKTSTDSYRFKLLNKRIFGLINDQSSDFNYYQKRRMFKRQIDHLSVFIENCLPICTLKVFQPDDLIKVFFDTLLALMTAFILLYIPIQISFNESLLGHNIYLDMMPAVTVVVELVVKLNSAFYKDGVVIQSRRSITLRYLKNDLFLDFCSILSFLIYQSGFCYVQLIILLRIKRLKQYIEKIEDITFIREKYAAQIDLIKLIFFLFYINHNGACLWNLVGEIQMGQQTENWIHFYDVVNVSLSQRYIRSFYWCMITTTTVGYGDVIPTNDLERIVSCLIIISGQIAFGYTISSIGEIFKQIEEKTNTFKTQMSKVTYYLKQKKFDKQLRMKIIRQFEYLYSQKYKSDHNEIENLITQLIPEMSAEVKIATYLPLLQKNKTFRTKFSPKLLNDLCQIMITKNYNNGQVIIDRNQTISELIFVAEGSLVSIAQQNNLRSYRSGFVVDLKNFIIQQPVSCQFKAETSCTLYLLPYESFKQSLKKYQEDWEIFQMLKDDLIFKQNHKLIGQVCKVCQSNHHFLNCPFPFFQFNRNKLIRCQLQEQKRVFTYRKNNRMMSFRQALHDYQLDAISASINFTNLKVEDIDESYEAKLGLSVERGHTLSLNQPSGSNFQNSQKEISSKLQMNSQLYDREISLKENRFSNLQVLTRSRQSSIKRASYLNLNPRSFLQQKSSEVQNQPKEQDQEIKFSQLEQIQLQEQLQHFNNTLNLDKYADFKFYKKGHNLEDILNEFTEIQSKQTIRPGSSNKYFQKKKSLYSTQKSKQDKNKSMSHYSIK